MANNRSADETAQLILEKERIEAQWDTLISELREQGYREKEIRKILLRTDKRKECGPL